MTKKQRKEFEDFLFDNLDHILKTSDFGSWRSNVKIEDKYLRDQEGSYISFEIYPRAEYQKFSLFIYKSVQDDYEAGNYTKIYETLCHEVGHLHTTALRDLIYQVHKSEEEITRADENLATKIGYYLYKLSLGPDEKCQKKTKKHNPTKKMKNKKR